MKSFGLEQRRRSEAHNAGTENSYLCRLFRFYMVTYNIQHLESTAPTHRDPCSSVSIIVHNKFGTYTFWLETVGGFSKWS